MKDYMGNKFNIPTPERRTAIERLEKAEQRLSNPNPLTTADIGELFDAYGQYVRITAKTVKNRGFSGWLTKIFNKDGS